MFGALLIVFVLSSDPPERTRAFATATREVLGSSSEVRIEEEAVLPDERRAAELPADVIVELSPGDSADEIVLHCYLSREKRWVNRIVSFSPGDREAERGRLLGFAVASMLVDAPVAPRPLPPEPEPAPQREAPRDDGERALAGAVQPASTFEVAATVRTGVDTVGASAGFRAPLSARVSWRVSLGASVGDLPVAQATTQTVITGVGAALALTPPEWRFTTGVRFDALGSWLQVSHLSEDDEEADRQRRLLFGGAAMAEIGYRFSGALGLYAAGGLEAMLGETDIYVHGERVATLPAWRGAGELGIRSTF
jgi:hypothetical protein